MVHTLNGVVEFKPSARGLHYVDVSADETIRHIAEPKIHVEIDVKVIYHL
jgi:hypothetical protein